MSEAPSRPADVFVARRALNEAITIPRSVARELCGHKPGLLSWLFARKLVCSWCLEPATGEPDARQHTPDCEMWLGHERALAAVKEDELRDNEGCLFCKRGWAVYDGKCEDCIEQFHAFEQAKQREKAAEQRGYEAGRASGLGEGFDQGRESVKWESALEGGTAATSKAAPSRPADGKPLFWLTFQPGSCRACGSTDHAACA